MFLSKKNETGFILNFLIIFLFLSHNLISQQQIDGLVKEGLKYSYNFELEKAESIFNQIIKKYPDDPRGYHYKSSIYIWNYLGNSEKTHFNNFLQLSSQAIEKAELVLDENEKNEIANYILGSNHGYRAIAFGKAGKYLEMIWASQKSNSYLKDVLKINPNNFDSYLGLGLFKFALSQVPSGFKWALNMIGFEGNQEEGLDFLKKASEKGIFAKTEAEYYLSQIYSEFYYDFEKSSELLKNLSQKYPQNILFLYSLAVVDIKRRDLNSAEKLLTKLVKSDNKNFIQTICFSNFLMGDVLFRKNKFEEAKSFYKYFVTNSTIKDYYGIANYRLGLCCELTNDNQAINYYKQTEYGLELLEDDAFAKRKGEERLKTPLTDSEKKLILFTNYIECGEPNRAIDSLKKLESTQINMQLKAELYFALCQAYYDVENFEASIKYATASTELENSNETWIKPFSYLYIARNYWKIGNIEKAIEYLENAEDLSDYDYRVKLNGMINNLKLKLKN
jgi:tetratricopeptide (TPR) repeat protein